MFARKCKRICGLKKLVLLTLACCFALYARSVWLRARRLEETQIIIRTTTAKPFFVDVSAYPNVSEGICGPECGANQISFYVKTGVEKDEPPIICVHRSIVMHSQKNNVGRGMNVVVINNNTLKVEAVKSYDTYQDDYQFLRDLMTGIKEGHAIIMASFDEITQSLSEEARRWMKLFGAKQVDSIGYRDSYMLIGQKGLVSGDVLEFRVPKKQKNFADHLEKMGCLSLPLGEIKAVESVLPKVMIKTDMKFGADMPNCGLSAGCHDHSFPVMVSTGVKSDNLPEICVSGKIVMAKDVNNAGRGMNVVIVDHKTGQPKSINRYDTYEKDSIHMEILLETLIDMDIVIMSVHDDGSRKLTLHTMEMLNGLGSSLIQNLKFRDVWYFVGQKGLKGFSTLEKISYAGMDGEWPTPLKDSFCVSSKVQSTNYIPDPVARRNDVKREFCKKYDGYGDFCSVEHVDDPLLTPAKLVDDKLAQNAVYSSPIIVIPGFNHNALVQTLETVIMQPGVSRDHVLVAYDEKFPEHGELAAMFGFRNVSVSDATEFSVQVIKALEKGAEMFPNAKYMIVLDEELMLSPDFLSFLAQCTHVLDKDDSLIGVSAFNFNGLDGMQTNKSLMYKVEDFPGLGFMIKMEFFKIRMKHKLKNCCNARSWEGWSMQCEAARPCHMLVPDMSRVFRQVYEGMTPDDRYLTSLFNTPRETSLDSKVSVRGLEELTAAHYDAHLKGLLSGGTVLKPEQLHTCSSNISLAKDSR
ncbi:protein O-linked-mannose beta-1,2-N-acetylglucosaminyltransferase 1-like isoform X1 [Dreissena polymorpha]|uniref:protein O-linked-mannose beta-1,2-N-acetylglucosaminyltransferase 1-like isoform X1 n=1 Tax=Dreissena polymorpha TaxID=45954 RepID=UPI002264752D|nr:protein O-linked-mannose beta-1,2-N-acetylglucosaminyltransferase 1-like isoform X1 [Dreissena polymorpha]